MDKVSLRDVGNEQIYDSYMGILRISPSQLDNTYVDSMSLFLTNPVDDKGNFRKIILSDSDGIKLGLYFTSKVRETDVKDANEEVQKQNVINVVAHSESNLFVSQDLHIRSTLIVNVEKQKTKVAPIQIYHESPYYVGAYDVLNYPIESPNDNSYFNSKNVLELIDYSSSKDVHTQLTEALFNKSKAWYDEHIKAEDRVKIGDKFIYTQNKDYEQIPVVYTKEYALGHYTGHTARVTDDVKTKFISQSIGPDKVTNQSSVITKLSFIEIDKLVWEIVHEAAQGYIRHTEGRYTLLGIGENESISERLFGQINPPTSSSPLIGMGVSPGIVLDHAMPFRRFIFHVLRQQLRNREDEGNNYANASEKVRGYVTAGKITPFAKQDPGFVNMLTKEFVLCDGRELTYDNYPSVNTDNTSLFIHDAKGIVQRDNNTKKPVKSTAPSDIYKAISKCFNNKVIVPSLLALEQQSPRYLRGLTWKVNILGIDEPISFSETDIPENTYQENTVEFEIVKDSDYGLTPKNFSVPGLFRANIDWKATKVHHKHLCFYNSNTYNREQKDGNSFGSMGNYPAPYYWNTVADTIPDKDNLIKYSFTKNKRVNGEPVINTWSGHTPVPSAGLFAWKIKDDGSVNNDAATELQNGELVIQNSEETVISADIEERKKQLTQINIADGAAPIASKGGSSTGRGTYTYIQCEKREKSGHHNRWRDNYMAYSGGYVLQKAIESDTEFPRGITSLPHASIEDEKNASKEELKVTMGDKVITPDTTLSFPPTVVLLPLFKI